MAKDEFHLDDVGVKIVVSIKNEKGQYISLSSNDVIVHLKIKKPNGVEVEWLDLEVAEDEKSVIYTTKLNDLDQAGTYRVYPKLHFNDGRVISGSAFSFTVVNPYTDSTR